MTTARVSEVAQTSSFYSLYFFSSVCIKQIADKVMDAFSPGTGRDIGSQTARTFPCNGLLYNL